MKKLINKSKRILFDMTVDKKLPPIIATPVKMLIPDKVKEKIVGDKLKEKLNEIITKKIEN